VGTLNRHPWPTPRAPVPERDRSGDDVWNRRVDHLLDLILEAQLALFKPGDLKLVANSLLQYPSDLFIKRAMLGPELIKGGARIVVVHLTQSLDER